MNEGARTKTIRQRTSNTHTTEEMEETVTPETIKNAIRTEVLKMMHRDNSVDPLGDDEPIMTTHMLDSLDAMDLLSFIEGKYGIPAERLGGDFDTIDTVNMIVDYIVRDRN